MFPFFSPSGRPGYKWPSLSRFSPCSLLSHCPAYTHACSTQKWSFLASMGFNWEFFNCSLLENTKKSICWLLSLSIKEQREILTFLRKNFRSYICGRPTHSKYRPHHIFSQAKISQLQGGSLVFISLNLQGIKMSKPSNCNWDKEGFWHSVRVQPGQSSNNLWKLMGYPRTATSSWTSMQPLTFSTKEPDLGSLYHRRQHHRVIRWDAQIHGSNPVSQLHWAHVYVQQPPASWTPWWTV